MENKIFDLIWQILSCQSFNIYIVGVYLDLVIHYAEIGLKGKNRLSFEMRLVSNIDTKLRLKHQSGLLRKEYKVRRKRGYILIENVDGEFDEQMVEKEQENMDEQTVIFNVLSKTPGVENFYLCKRVELSDHKDILSLDKLISRFIDKISKRLWEQDIRLWEQDINMKRNSGEQNSKLIHKPTGKFDGKHLTFKLETKRVDKSFKYRSPEINMIIGKKLEKEGYIVDYKKPDIIVNIEIHKGFAYVYDKKYKGMGGLPCGVEGKVACLLSGGIDSPVAAVLMLKRGCTISLIHYHNTPEPHDKIFQIYNVLKEYDPNIDLITISFIDVQKEIISVIPEKYRMIVYRRFMLRIAERLAEKNEFKAIVTGDSLGQVASQTLENMKVISSSINMLVLRPLITYNKQETIDLAKKIGTFELSLIPSPDCCSYMIGKHPATKSKLDDIIRLEKALDMDEMTKMAMMSATKYV